MDRYNKANGVDVAPAAPPAADHPYYTAGDPQNDIPATTPGPWWFHMITESMRNVIIAAGLVPQWNVLTLFLDAIKILIAGGDYKSSCRVASTANINIAAPGANIDGIAMAVGNRALLKDQAAPAQNGIYIWNGAAVPMTRAADADDGVKLNSGAIIPIEQGTVNADTNWQLTTDGVITIGVTALTFAAFTTSQATETVAGKAEIATQLETDAGADDLRIVTPLKLKNGFAISLATNGYIKFPTWLGGWVLQWATVTATSSSSVGWVSNLTLPLTFPTAGLAAGGNYKAASSVSGCFAVNVSFTSTSVLAVSLDAAGNGEPAGSQSAFVWAVGY